MQIYVERCHWRLQGSLRWRASSRYTSAASFSPRKFSPLQYFPYLRLVRKRSFKLAIPKECQGGSCQGFRFAFSPHHKDDNTNTNESSSISTRNWCMDYIACLASNSACLGYGSGFGGGLESPRSAALTRRPPGTGS